MDRAGRWHVAFAAIPEPIAAPGNGQVVGIDRGVAVSAALWSGERLSVPGLQRPERQRLRRLEHRLASAHRGSGRRRRVRLDIARLKARERDRRKDWALFACVACGFASNADVNAARNIAAPVPAVVVRKRRRV
jgi:transposase